MVDPVSPISATAASAAIRIDHSTSITSEPDNLLVATRQSQMTANLLALKRPVEDEHKRDDEDEAVTRDDHHSMERQVVEPFEEEAAAEEEAEATTLSGESERIGSVNFDDDTPFGERVAII